MSLKNSSALILAMTVYLLALALWYANILELPAGRWIFYNSDSVVWPAFFLDLRQNPYAFADWQFSAATFYFPDMVLYGLVYFCLQHVHWAIVFAGVAQVTLFIFSLMWLSRQMFGRQTAVQCLLCYCGAGFFVYAAHQDVDWHRYLLLADFHFGAYLVGMAVLALCMKLLRRAQLKSHWQYGWPALVAIGLLSVATATSDLFYVLQVAAPLGLALVSLIVISKKKMRRLVLLAALVMASVPIATLLAKMLGALENAQAMSNHSRAAITQAWMIFLNTYCLHIWKTQRLAAFVWIAFVLGSCFVIAQAIYRRRRGRVPAVNYALFHAFLLASMVINIVGIIYNGLCHIRYFMPFFLMPVFFGWPLLIGGWRGLILTIDRHWIQHWLAAGFILGLFLLPRELTVEKLASLKGWGDYYPGDVQNVDAWASRHQFKNGLGDYWHAKRMSLLSKAGVHISCVDRNLDAQIWLSSRGDYDRQYDFILAAGLNEEIIQKVFGRPKEAGGPERAMVYETAEFRDQFKGGPFTTRIRKVGDEAVLLPATFYGPAGVREGFSRVAGRSPTPGGMMMCSRQMKLPRGKYMFSISGTTAGKKAVGRLLVADPETHQIFINVNIPPGRKGTLCATQVALPSRKRFELRIDYPGEGFFKLDTITIKKTG